MLWIAIGTASGSTWSLQEKKMTIINAMKKMITEIKIKLRGIEERHKHKRRIKNIEKDFL